MAKVTPSADGVLVKRLAGCVTAACLGRGAPSDSRATVKSSQRSSSHVSGRIKVKDRRDFQHVN